VVIRPGTPSKLGDVGSGHWAVGHAVWDADYHHRSGDGAAGECMHGREVHCSVVSGTVPRGVAALPYGLEAGQGNT
jgi:hypothetical protein